MTFTQAVRSVLSNYATFTGRARRSEYWWFYLFNILLGIATSVVDGILNTAFNNDIGIVGTVTSLALLLPSLAVTARRLHDTGRTGWWMLLPVGPGLATIAVGFVDAFAALFSGDANRVPLMGALTVVFLACGLLSWRRQSSCSSSCAWTPSLARTSTAPHPSSRPCCRPGRVATTRHPGTPRSPLRPATAIRTDIPNSLLPLRRPRARTGDSRSAACRSSTA